ncbi:ABC transporter permease [Aliirhizobium cellulosilyticum]|uniref:Peptide/nickel transport system permease protein n=1 Tax=Aliirhizobium cellulosilyticum TaxID=393664 RepID=A0A7W6XB57_9HYPH|nr:ABC transporter permease [Rhizobium cellulosilyticum]MBB4349312.1 peptide/nickel transport system permease protein [Rhizobium cellulosilyticum]MBB4412466.1 peptide/nickel transport system permease protein [Rhizobium cellulosilyticum]MBB4447098.1 peptide/nickel transport system permease protein [Rhizobium cellulosilyticum]
MTVIESSYAGQRRKLVRGAATLTAGGLLLGAIATSTLLASVLAGWDPLDIDIVNAGAAPSFSDGHLLGTDDLGRDILSRVLYGGRIALAISFFGSFSGCLVGTVLAFASVAIGKKDDHFIPRLADAQLAIPNLIFAIVLVAFFGSEPAVLALTITLATWVLPFRIARASFASTLTQPYVEASRMAGLSILEIARHHLTPVLLPQLAVTMSIGFSTALILVSSLGYLGLGPQPPAPDWGRMVAEAQGQIGLAWWASVFPGLAIVLTLVGSQLFGDGVAEILSLSSVKERDA